MELHVTGYGRFSSVFTGLFRLRNERQRWQTKSKSLLPDSIQITDFSNKPVSQQFICKRRIYTNNLPTAQLACPVKFLNLPFQNIERYARCAITKMESDYKYEVWPEEILKHCPPLVDLNIFKRDENAVVSDWRRCLNEFQFLDGRERCSFVGRRLCGAEQLKKVTILCNQSL
jgi:hypothetical protein